MQTCLYVTYDGLLDPLGQSQILPYIKNLNKNGFKFIIISYEKVGNQDKFLELKQKLEELDIYWKPLKFHKSKINFLFRFIVGAIYINFIQFTRKIDLVHLRGGIPGLIFLLSLSRKKYLYDLRAFWGQWAEGSNIKKNSFLYKILLKIEKRIINNSDGIIVLDQSGKKYINKFFNYEKPLKVISTSTNIDRYQIKSKINNSCIKFVHLGGASYPPYKIKNALNLINYLMNIGYKCEIDFINKNQHQIIERILKNKKFQQINANIIYLDHSEIYQVLPNYDIGLVFLEKGEWLNMSSPTKIGEYLAAGLGVIGNKGIAILDRIYEESNCILTIDINKEKLNFNYDEIQNFLKNINNINFKKKCRNLAENHYSLKIANEKYLSIYRKLFEKVLDLNIE